jgi:hypothetical protein
MTACDFSTDIVCISESYVAATQLVAMYQKVGSDGKESGPDEEAIARLGVRIEDLHSDNIIEVSTNGMTRECQGALCVHYIRSCTDDKLSCRFVVGAAERSDSDYRFVPREFAIVARSIDEFRAAAVNIHIGLAGVQGTIAVAALQDEHSMALLRKYSAWSVN